MTDKIDIMVVDDNEFYRKGLVLSLKRQSNVNNVLEAENGLDFLKKIDSVSSDIIFMDIRMPVMDGITATKKAINSNNFLNIIALTMHRDEEYLMEMILAGAKGFLLKDSDEKEISQAIKSVLHGINYYSKSVFLDFKLPNNK